MDPFNDCRISGLSSWAAGEGSAADR